MSIALGHTDRRSAVADPLPEGLEPGPARSAAGCTLGRSTPRTSNREPMIQNTPTFRRHPNTFGNRPHVQQQHPAVRRVHRPARRTYYRLIGLLLNCLASGVGFSTPRQMAWIYGGQHPGLHQGCGGQQPRRERLRAAGQSGRRLAVHGRNARGRRHPGAGHLVVSSGRRLLAALMPPTPS